MQLQTRGQTDEDRATVSALRSLPTGMREGGRSRQFACIVSLHPIVCALRTCEGDEAATVSVPLGAEER